jgi:hypothetical protein
MSLVPLGPMRRRSTYHRYACLAHSPVERVAFWRHVPSDEDHTLIDNIALYSEHCRTRLSTPWDRHCNSPALGMSMPASYQRYAHTRPQILYRCYNLSTAQPILRWLMVSSRLHHPALPTTRARTQLRTRTNGASFCIYLERKFTVCNT